MAKALSDRLLALLETEREAITSGTYAVLAELTRLKQDVADRLVDTRPSRAELARVGQMVARNQRLLEAAQGGMRSAAERIAALSRPDAGFGAYGADGSITAIGAPLPAVEHKA